MGNSVKLGFCLVFLAVTVTKLFASSQNAVIYGGVYDLAGNPLAEATVTLTNTTIGFSRATITGGDGSYEFTEVPPASGYELIAIKGAKTIDSRAGITVNVGDERVLFPPLREHATTEITVRAAPTTVAITSDVVSTSISGVITGTQLRSLPLYNRNFLALGLLAPDTFDPPAGSPLTGASFSVSGARVSSNDFLLDGLENVATSNKQAIPFQVNDSIQEYRVITADGNAEYGHAAGGIVNVVTQRGTNSFHGSAFGYLGSDRLNARNPLSVYSGTTFNQAAQYAGSTTTPSIGRSPGRYNSYVATAAANGFCTDGLPTGCNHTFFNSAAVLARNNSHVQPFDSKQYGLNMGGPIVKDKLFVFGSYEGTKIDNPNQIFERVPSAFDKTYDPLRTGTLAFTATNPNFVLAQNVLGLYPAANVIAVPGVLEFYRGSAPNYTDVNNGLVRFDYVQSDQSDWSLRYAVQQLNQLHDDSLPQQPKYAGDGAFRKAFNQSLELVYSHAISHGLTYKVRGGFSRFLVEDLAQDAKLNATGLGLPAPSMMTFLLSGLDTEYSGASPGTNGAYGGWADTFYNGSSSVMVPSLDGLFPFARVGAPLTAPSLTQDSTLSGDGALSWIHGPHATQFGVEYGHHNNHYFNGAFSRGFVVAGDIGEFTHDSVTCNENCGLAFAAPSFDYALRQSSPYFANFNSYVASGYIQDTWRLGGGIVINMGLRYDYFSIPLEAKNQIWNFDPAANGLVQQGGTSVVDPYGHVCGSAAAFPYGAVYADETSNQTWICNPEGNGRSIADSRNDTAPRVGVAWNIFGNGKTVLRGGIGWFFDQLPVNDTAQLIFNRPSPVVANSPQATYGQNFNSTFCYQCGLGNSSLNPAVVVARGTQNFQSASSPFAMYARDYGNSSTPYARQINLSIQQQITTQVNLEVGYVGSSGKRLPIVVNTGFLNEWFCFSHGCNGNLDLPVFTMTNQGSSSFHSLVARVQAAQWRGLQMHATYTFGRSLDNDSDPVFPLVPSPLFNQAFGFQGSGTGNPSEVCLIFGLRCGKRSIGAGSVVGGTTALTTTGAGQIFVTPYTLPQDPLHFLRDEYGPSDFNIKHRFVADYTWDIPSFPGRFLRGLLNHWQASGVLDFQTGQPFTVFGGPLFGELTQRANIAGPITIHNADPSAAISSSGLGLASIRCGFVTSADVLGGVPGKPCTGNSGRNAFVGPSYMTVNMALQKAIPIHEAVRFIIRAEAYNLMNRANYYNPISALSLDGLTNNPDFGKIKSAHDPRQIQISARFSW